MSTVLGGNGLKEVYMKLASFGALQISVTLKADNPEIMSVDIGAETRREALHMETNKDETVDQFCQRIKSMLRSLWNTEPRVAAASGKEEKPAQQKEQTWEEQKAVMKGKGQAPAQSAPGTK